MSENNRLVGLFLVVPLLCGSVSFAQNSSFPAQLEEIYGSNDPMLSTKIQLEKMMGVYLTNVPRRHRSERVGIKGKEVTVDVWQSVYGQSDAELKCRALRWLVFGRTQYVQGGRQVLSEMPNIEQVALRFHVVEHSRNSRRVKRGRERIRRYLTVKLSRKSLNRLDLESLKAIIESGNCDGVFTQTFRGKLLARYTKKRRDAR